MHRTTPAVLLALSLATGSVAATSPPAKAVTLPDKITAVSAGPGPGAGQVTIRWAQRGRNTTAFQIETAVSSFSPTKKSLPRHGRHGKYFTVSAARRSVTLSAAQVASSGASAASGNLMYFRVYALNRTASGTAVRRYPYLKAVLPRPVAPKKSGTQLRAATFNVRTARATSDKRTWLQRAPDVARQILTYRPGVVALQELGPGRADGKSGSTASVGRQTTSLESALARAGGRRYQLVRTTPYLKPGSPSGSQGARILYDTSRYVLRSSCPETTSGRAYSSSCTIAMPLLPGTNEDDRRRATYALLQDRRTAQRFYVVSAHLDSWHSSNATRERAYEAHRGRQASTVVRAMDRINRSRLPIVFGGDLNGWQNNPVADAAHEALTRYGYYDSASAGARINMAYATVNHFDTRVKPKPLGVSARLDVVAIKGRQGARRIQNVVKAVDSARPSDHNMVVSDLVL